MTGADREALVTAYALGALTREESDEAERLVAGSSPLRAVYEDALETALLLALATADVDPPAGLRSRIVDAAVRLRDRDRP